MLLIFFAETDTPFLEGGILSSVLKDLSVFSYFLDTYFLDLGRNYELS